MNYAFPELVEANAAVPFTQSNAGTAIGFSRARPPEPKRLPLLALAIAAHVGVVFIATQWAMTKQAPLEIQPMMVSITPTAIDMPASDPEPPKPAVPKIDVALAPTITLDDVAPSPPNIVQTTSAEQPTQAAAVTPPNFEAAYLRNPAPVYPNVSRRLRETGTVQLRVRVSAEGLPLEIQLAKSSGFARLDESALDAVRKYRFQAAMRGDTAVEAWVVVPVEFSLGNVRR